MAEFIVEQCQVRGNIEMDINRHVSGINTLPIITQRHVQRCGIGTSMYSNGVAKAHNIKPVLICPYVHSWSLVALQNIKFRG